MELNDWSMSIGALIPIFLLIGLLVFSVKTLLKVQAESQLVNQKNLERILNQSEKTTEKFLETLETLTDKSLSLLSVKDPISFQQIQAMSSPLVQQEPVDNSDRGEMLQWIDENPDLTEQEKAAYSAIPDL